MAQLRDPDPKVTVNRAMSAIVTKEELCNFNWTGTGAKKPFSQYNNIISGIAGTYKSILCNKEDNNIIVKIFEL